MNHIKKIWLILLLGFPTNLFATYSFISSGAAASTNTTSVTVTLNTTNANLIIINISDDNPQTACTLTDSLGNTWQTVNTVFVSNDIRVRTIINSNTGNVAVGVNHSFTCSSSPNSSYPSMAVQSWGGAPISPFDTSNNATGGTISSISTGQIVTTQPGELIISALGIDGTQTTQPTASSISGGFTIRNQATYTWGVNYGIASASFIEPNSGTNTNPNWTTTVTANFLAASIVSFKASTTPNSAYYVRSTANSDTGLCSDAHIDDDAHARKTINGGLNCLNSGDTLIIHAATSSSGCSSGVNCYVERLDNEQGTSNIPSGGGTDATRTIIKAASGETVWLQPPGGCGNCAGATANSINSSWVTIDGINVDLRNITPLENGVGPLVTNASARGWNITLNAHHLTITTSSGTPAIIKNGNLGIAGDCGRLNGGCILSNMEIMGMRDTTLCRDNAGCPTGHGGYGTYVCWYGSTMDNNYSHANANYGILVYDNGILDCSHNTFKNNRIDDINGTVPVCNVGNCPTAGGTGITYFPGFDPSLPVFAGGLLYNNVITNIGSATPSIGGIGIEITGINDVNVYNNTIFTVTNGVSNRSAQNINVKNNIILSSNTPLLFISGSQNTDRNLCDSACGSGSFTSTPAVEFVTTSGVSGFHLNSGAVARNNGINFTATCCTTDRDGVGRPSLPTAWDIGAYQFGSSGVTLAVNALQNVITSEILSISEITISPPLLTININSEPLIPTSELFKVNIRSFIAPPADFINNAETIITFLPYLTINQSELITTSEILALLMIFLVIIANEPTSITDIPSIFIPILTPFIVESVNEQDSPNIIIPSLGGLPVFAQDSLHLTEIFNLLIPLLYFNAFETITINELASQVTDKLIPQTILETITLSEFSNLFMRGYSPFISDSINSSELIQILIQQNLDAYYRRYLGDINV